MLLPNFNQLKKLYGPLKNYPASNFAKLLSGVSALLNVFRRKARAKRPKDKDYKMAKSSVGAYLLKIVSRLSLFHTKTKT
jgi:hypothetical protein